jgi:hypothetical protein
VKWGGAGAAISDFRLAIGDWWFFYGFRQPDDAVLPNHKSQIANPKSQIYKGAPGS